MSRAAKAFSRARRAALACSALALLPGLAQAAGTPVWQDAQAGLPATVTLNAVAASNAIVVAVGADGDVPVAYRLADGAWMRTELAAPGTTGALTDVSVDAFGRGWAVGWQRAAPDAPARALVESLAPDGTWTPVSVGDTPALTAVAAAPDHAFTGDAAGVIRRLDADGLGAPLSWIAPGSATAVRSLALTTGLSAIAGGTPSSGAPASTALLDVNGSNNRVSQAPAVPSDAGAEIVAVAALPDGRRIALDGTACGAPASGAPGAWLPDPSSGAWRRDAAFPTGSTARACDVTLTSAGDALVAGSFDGKAAVWRRSSAGWARADGLAPGELRGIAATADGAWAVGVQGTVLRFGVPPAPPAPDPGPKPDPQPQPDPQAESPRSDSGGGAPSGDQPADAAPTSGSGEGDATQPSASSPPVVTVTVQAGLAREPVATGRRPQSQPVRRMLSRLAVRRLKGGRLQVRFRLRLPARLEVRALRGTRVVGRASRYLRAGARQLIVPYRGNKPPTRLDIVVRRAKAGTSKENTK